MVNPVWVDVEALKTVRECMLDADHASGYCCCGAKMVGHPVHDHTPMDGGEVRAENAIKELEKIIADLLK